MSKSATAFSGSWPLSMASKIRAEASLTIDSTSLSYAPEA